MDDNPQPIDFGIALRGYSIRLEEAVLDNDRSLIREYGEFASPVRQSWYYASDPGSDAPYLSNARALVVMNCPSLPDDAVGHARSVGD